PWQVMTAPVTVPLGAAKLAITHPGITAGTLALAGDLGNNAASGNALRQMGAADDASAPQDGSSTSTDGNFTWYQLQNGDTLQSIAKKQLGDANRWPEIYQANQDLFDSLGQNGTIPSGTKIKIPVDNTSPSSPSTNGSSDAAAYKQSLLKVLDQKIAASTGDTKTLLTQLRQRLATMPADQVYSLKDQLDAQGLTVDGGNQGTTPAPKPSPKPAPAPQAPGRPAPTAPTQTTPPSNGTRLYTVRQGDTLTGIAQSQLGDWNKWHTIVDMNQNRYPTLASNPDYIQSGWRLNLPVGSAGRTVSAASTSTPAPAPASTAPQNAAPAPGTVGPNTGTDAERQQLQNLLSQLGFDVQPTGKYDQSTADAVVAFKQMAGLPTDNADVDPDTKAAMQISLRLLQDPNVRSQANMEAAVHEAANLATGSIGPEVGSDQARALVQQYLQAVGYNVPVNGQFDQATLDALTQFKQQNGLAASYQDDQGNPVYTPYVDGPTAEALYNAASQTPSKSS
ncbi:MAG TPA: peptidoglycan-binding protein, partial [Oscillatoriaceae cyanobacterium]